MNNDHLDELDILLYDKMPYITDNILKKGYDIKKSRKWILFNIYGII